MSEFGRGYLTCLFQFANHAQRLGMFIDMYEGPDAPGYRRLEDLFPNGMTVMMWANGASDHLYELRRPVRIVPRSDYKQAQAMAAAALDAGHGFRDHAYAVDDARGWIDTAKSLIRSAEDRLGCTIETLDQAMRADVELGLHPDAGEWSCLEDIP